ncbi:hypothetical protein SCHPADRAFT_900123 [Schizopora paradoxa]|uniref:Uncharacterized protein n=1 Tax=Schizopora paradoxa TaxID=27342 RepID=A0A0H2SLJ3_9AGAM|nr:hypothetical protein SCHPADRAFT_900123 [Schizopora paradoxa]
MTPMNSTTEPKMAPWSGRPIKLSRTKKPVQPKKMILKTRFARAFNVSISFAGSSRTAMASFVVTWTWERNGAMEVERMYSVLGCFSSDNGGHACIWDANAFRLRRSSIAAVQASFALTSALSTKGIKAAIKALIRSNSARSPASRWRLK